MAAPLVDPLAELLAEDLSMPVRLNLLVASTETKRATAVP
jgi:hypothetical protein